MRSPKKLSNILGWTMSMTWSNRADPNVCLLGPVAFYIPIPTIESKWATTQA